MNSYGRALRRYHPSNILYNNEVDGFDHAMRLVVAECDTELTEFGTYVPDDFLTTEDIEKGLSGLKDFRSAANAALEIYNKALADSSGDEAVAREAVAHAFNESPDEYRQMVAESALSEDYTLLAI